MRTALLLAAIVALSLGGAARAGAPPPAKLSVGLLEARTHPDTHWYGEKAYLFRVDGITVDKSLVGHTITWTLDVKRKLAPWKRATSWLLTKQNVRLPFVHGAASDAAVVEMPQVTFGLIYRSLAKAHFLPGEHVARFVAKDERGNELYSGVVPFVLPANGPNAYKPRDYR